LLKDGIFPVEVDGAMSGLCSSDEDGGDMIMEDESDLMMDTTDVWS
jgi:hypothetical protein